MGKVFLYFVLFSVISNFISAQRNCTTAPLKTETLAHGVSNKYCEYFENPNGAPLQLLEGSEFTTKTCQTCICSSKGLSCCEQSKPPVQLPVGCKVIQDGCRFLTVSVNDYNRDCITGKLLRSAESKSSTTSASDPKTNHLLQLLQSQMQMQMLHPEYEPPEQGYMGARGMPSPMMLGGMSNPMMFGGMSNPMMFGGMSNSMMPSGMSNPMMSSGMSNPMMPGGMSSSMMPGGMSSSMMPGGMSSSMFGSSGGMKSMLSKFLEGAGFTMFPGNGLLESMIMKDLLTELVPKTTTPSTPSSVAINTGATSTPASSSATSTEMPSISISSNATSENIKNMSVNMVELASNTIPDGTGKDIASGSGMPHSINYGAATGLGFESSRTGPAVGLGLLPTTTPDTSLDLGVFDTLMPGPVIPSLPRSLVDPGLFGTLLSEPSINDPAFMDPFGLSDLQPVSTETNTRSKEKTAMTFSNTGQNIPEAGSSLLDLALGGTGLLRTSGTTPKPQWMNLIHIDPKSAGNLGVFNRESAFTSSIVKK